MPITISSRLTMAQYSLKIGSITPTNESPLTAPRPVTKQSATLRIQSFCDEVRDRDRSCVLTGMKAARADLGEWHMFEAGHIFPLALEQYWDAYQFTPKLYALPPKETDHPINSVQNGLLFTRNAHLWFDRYAISINPGVWPTVFGRFHG